MADVVLRLKMPIINMDEFEDGILSVFGAEIEAAVKRGAPVGPLYGGMLRDRWHLEFPIVNHQIVLANNTFYAPYVTQGTGIFGPNKRKICARGYRNPGVEGLPKAMAFRYGGQLMIRRCIKGMKPNPYVEEGIDTGCDNAVLALQQMYDKTA